MVERITSNKKFNDEVLGSIPSSGTLFLFILISKDRSYLFSKKIVGEFLDRIRGPELA